MRSHSLRLRFVMPLLVSLVAFGCGSRSKFQGRVTDATGKPLANLEVSATAHGDIAEERERTKLAGSTDAKGEFTISNALPERDYTIQVASAGWASSLVRETSAPKGQTKLLDEIVAVPYHGESGVFLVGNDNSLVSVPLGQWPHREPTIQCVSKLPVVNWRPFTVLSATKYRAQPTGYLFEATGYSGVYSAGGKTFQAPRKTELWASDGAQLTCWTYSTEAPAGVYAHVPFLHEGSAFVFRVAGRTAAEDEEVARAEAQAAARVAEERRKQEATAEESRRAEELARKTLVGRWGVHWRSETPDRSELMMTIEYTSDGRYWLEFARDMYSKCSGCREEGTWAITSGSMLIRSAETLRGAPAWSTYSTRTHQLQLLKVQPDEYTWSENGLEYDCYAKRMR